MGRGGYRRGLLPRTTQTGRRRRLPLCVSSSYRLSGGRLAIDGYVAAAGVPDTEDGRDVGVRARLSEVLFYEAADVLGHADS